MVAIWHILRDIYIYTDTAVPYYYYILFDSLSHIIYTHFVFCLFHQPNICSNIFIQYILIICKNSIYQIRWTKFSWLININKMCTANTHTHTPREHPATNNEKYFLYANFFLWFTSLSLFIARKELKCLVCHGSGSSDWGGTSLYLAKFDRLEFIYLFMGNIKICDTRLNGLL